MIKSKSMPRWDCLRLEAQEELELATIDLNRAEAEMEFVIDNYDVVAERFDVALERCKELRDML